MEFKLKEGKAEDFKTWFTRTRPEMERLAGIVGKRIGNNPVADLQNLLDDLSNAALDVMELTIQAREYYQDWVAKATEEQLALGWTASKKTAQDYAVKLSCNEKRILDRLEAISAAVEYRTTSAQSVLRSMKG